METILVMSLSGSCMYILAMLWEWITKDRYDAKIYYFMLKLAVLFYLVPLAVLRDIYRLLFRGVISRLREMRVPQIRQMNNLYFTYEDAFYISDTLQIKLLCLCVWLIVAWGILVYQLLKYHKCQKRLEQCRDVQVLSEDERYLESCCKSLGISRTVLLCPYELEKNCNFTVGVTKPLIIYDPTNEERERQQILRHELVHIKHWDMLWAILMWAVICVHWFNPLVWIMKRKYVHVREMACDDEVLKDCTVQERGQYAQLIFRQMCEGGDTKYGMTLSVKGKMCKERVENVMKMNKKKLGVAGVFGMVAMVMLNTLTVFAYPEVSKFDMSDSVVKPNMEEVVSAEWTFVPEECAEEYLYPVEYNMEILSEYQFVDEKGNIYELSEAQFNGENVERVICNHNYEKGYSQMHVKLTNGGCIVYTYESERCTLCGDVKNTEQVSKMEYVKCPH